MAQDKTRTYLKKRKFDKTGEPRGGGNNEYPFVIQRHDARQLHYDFRLSIDGALKSWAVPKGPSTDPSEKRLAIEVEDHPLGYADFEGTIPEGEYGAGTVMLWDRGDYDNLRARGDSPLSMADSHKDGLIEVWLKGEKISGGYALKRFREGKKPQWLLIKMKDEEADARRNPTSTENLSVKSGRTLTEISKTEKDD